MEEVKDKGNSACLADKGDIRRVGESLPVRTRLQREIKATDRQIDQLVYELYGGLSVATQ